MRMWMVDPALMCDKHLLGEHVECHMLAGTLARGKSISGFTSKRLIEPSSLGVRHDDLAEEMTARGFRHESPLVPPHMGYLAQVERNASVDTATSARDLAARCERCRITLVGKPPTGGHAGEGAR